MPLYRITNRHQAEDCPELADELASYYEARPPAGNVTVYCNCGTGEHEMLFLAEAEGPVEALQAIPPGFLRTSSAVSQVEEAYKFATGPG